MVVTVRVSRAVRRRAGAVTMRAKVVARGYAPGAMGEAARLRRELERARLSVRSGLSIARVTRAPIGDVPALLKRIEAAAVSVDAELRMVESMRDRSRMAAALEGPRSRAVALVAAADDLTAGLVAASGAGGADMSLLQAECAIEAEALRAAGDRERRQGSPAAAEQPPISPGRRRTRQ